MKRTVIFHGGCLGCTNQGDFSICRGCCYKKSDWDLPNLSKMRKNSNIVGDVNEVLDRIDIQDIERYLRNKKLKKLEDL